MNTVPRMDVVIGNPVSLSNDKVIMQTPIRRKTQTQKVPKFAPPEQLSVDIELLLSQRLEKMLQ